MTQNTDLRYDLNIWVTTVQLPNSDYVRKIVKTSSNTSSLHHVHEAPGYHELKKTGYEKHLLEIAKSDAVVKALLKLGYKE